MKQLSIILISAIVFLTSCQDVYYDPSVPYPLLNPGDFWVDKFDQRGMQNAIIYKDKIYCNTIDVSGDRNFLYCLNPKNGRVVWRKQVIAHASQPVSFYKDIIIYSSYLGDISAFDSGGASLWKAKFDHPYGGHWLDTINSRVLVKTVYWKYVSAYDVKSGKLISDTENDSLQKQIERKMKDEKLLEKHEYRFTEKGKTYTLKGSPSNGNVVGEYTIEIEK